MDALPAPQAPAAMVSRSAGFGPRNTRLNAQQLGAAKTWPWVKRPVSPQRTSDSIQPLREALKWVVNSPKTPKMGSHCFEPQPNGARDPAARRCRTIGCCGACAQDPLLEAILHSIGAKHGRWNQNLELRFQLMAQPAQKQLGLFHVIATKRTITRGVNQVRNKTRDISLQEFRRAKRTNIEGYKLQLNGMFEDYK